MNHGRVLAIGLAALSSSCAVSPGRLPGPQPSVEIPERFLEASGNLGYIEIVLPTGPCKNFVIGDESMQQIVRSFFGHLVSTTDLYFRDDTDVSVDGSGLHFHARLMIDIDHWICPDPKLDIDGDIRVSADGRGVKTIMYGYDHDLTWGRITQYGCKYDLTNLRGILVQMLPSIEQPFENRINTTPGNYRARSVIGNVVLYPVLGGGYVRRGRFDMKVCPPAYQGGRGSGSSRRLILRGYVNSPG